MATLIARYGSEAALVVAKLIHYNKLDKSGALRGLRATATPCRRGPRASDRPRNSIRRLRRARPLRAPSCRR